MEKEKNIVILSEEEYQELDMLRERRNFWSHVCYTEAYEKNTGILIADDFEQNKRDYTATPAVLCKNHGVFTWGKNAHDAVHNAVVAEECAKMAALCEMINPKVEPAPQELQDKHYYRKHGANAYYGQIKKE